MSVNGFYDFTDTRKLIPTNTTPSSRHIPAPVKRTVQERDANRCNDSHNYLRITLCDGTVLYLDPWRRPSDPVFGKDEYGR